jgi:prepilin-type N-terminal cleavage/methylation domain-containing protein
VNRKSGFTLIEMLVVISLVVIIALIAGNIFFTTVRSSTKTRLSTDLKQKGNYALTLMERMIRQASEINDCQTDEIEITYLDEQTTTFSCSGGEIASNSANLAVLTDGVADCSSFIDCSNLPEVAISFSLTRGPELGLPFQKSTLDFQTKVTVRNY